jgi:hypothetical protein
MSLLTDEFALMTACLPIVTPIVGLSIIHEGGELWQFGTELVSDLAPPRPGSFGIVLGEGGGDESADDARALLPAWPGRCA